MKQDQKYAFVQDNRWVVLSPTKVEKAWYLIRHNKATLVKTEPMVIRLNRKQNNTDMSFMKVGLDPGDTTGVAIVQESHLNMSKNKAVFKANIQHRNDIKSLIESRREYRRLHRYNKRYRQARFNNRASSRRKGKVAPSIKNKKDEILRVLRYLSKYVCIDGIYIEDVSFDIRALTDEYKPYRWQYQRSNRLDENIRKAVIQRDKCKCKMCGAKDTQLEVHHITPKREGGNNTLKNLITLCSECHKSITGVEDDYKSYLYSLIDGKQIPLAPAMHVMLGKNYLYQQLRQFIGGDSYVYLTTGGDTANSRLDWNIKKSHSNDAACITDVRCLPENLKTYVYTIKPQRKKKKTKQNTSNLAIKHRDLVWYTPRGRAPIKCYVTAIMQTGCCAGKYKLKSVDGERFGPIAESSLRKIQQGTSSLMFI